MEQLQFAIDSNKKFSANVEAQLRDTDRIVNDLHVDWAGDAPDAQRDAHT